MNKKILVAVVFAVIALGAEGYFLYTTYKDNAVVVSDSSKASITYKNTEYGFNFTLPADWQGYAIVKDSWKGTALTSASAPSGPKLFIRNPKWTVAAHYEDLPILVFTTSQWNAYLAEGFSVSAAPIQASELGRNNRYVFALPPRWDFDYSLGYEDAQGIIVGKPLHAFTIDGADKVQGKLNINMVCERATSYMRFTDVKSAEVFVADCKEGKHPEVIEKYKADMNLGAGVMI